MANEAPTPLGAITPTQLPFIMGNAAIPKVYLQGFANFASPFDISMVAVNCGVPTGVITLSYGTAKALGAALQELVATYENAMNTKLPDNEEGNRRLTEAAAKVKK